MPILTTLAPPSWVYEGACIDLDFANNRYWGLPALWHGQGNATSNIAGACAQWVDAGNKSNILLTKDTDGIWKYPTLSSLASEVSLPRRNNYGLWIEGTGNDKNLALWSRDLTNAAWVVSSAGADFTITKNQTGCDNTASGACLVTCNTNNGTILQSITIASTTISGSGVLKRSAGSGIISMTIDGGATWTDITSQIGSTFSQCKVPFQTIANPQFGFKFATAGDALVVDCMQCENNRVATSPINTTTTALQRGTNGNGGFYFDSAGSKHNAGYRIITDLYHDTELSVLYQYSGNFDPVAGHILFGDDQNNCIVIGAAGGGAVTIHARNTNGSGSTTYTSTATETNGLYTLNKTMVGLDGTKCKIAINGSDVESSTATHMSVSDDSHRSGSFNWGSTTNGGTTHGQLGNNGAETSPQHGYVKRVTYWKRMNTDSQFKELTTVVEPY